MFKDRTEAGKRLAQALLPYQKESPVALALPRGGVAVGAEVARLLRVRLEVLVVRKIGAPDNPEFGIGAVTEDRVNWVNPAHADLVGLVPEDLKKLIDREYEEVKRRVRLLRAGAPPPDVRGRTALIVDDGLATGVTARAAALWVKKKEAKKILLAVPVCAASSADEMGSFVHRVICLEKPSFFFAVGEWYEDFPQVSDEEVLALLKKFQP